MSQVLTTTLADVSRPGLFICRDISESGEIAVRLKRFGICSGRQIEVRKVGDPMLLRVLGTDVGVSRRAAEHVTLEPLADLVHE